MKRYLYTGPMQSLEIRVADAEGASQLVAVSLVPDKPVDLPEGHPVTVAMTDAGFLLEPPAETPSADETAPTRQRVRAGAETPKE